MRRVFLIMCGFVLINAAGTQAQDSTFVEAEISNLTPFVGEQTIYTFRIFSRVAVIGQPVEPAFDGFWLQAMDTSSYQTLIGDQSYVVREQSFALFPTRAGSIDIEPMLYVIPGDVFNEGEVLRSESIRLQAQTLPEQVNLEDFDGAVGQYEMVPTLDRQTTIVGEPIALHLTIRGSGNVAQMSAPDLPESDTWRTYSNPSQYQASEVDGVILGEKTFSWLLTPLEAGQVELPALTLSFFDPDSLSYRTISTSPVAIEVQPGANPVDTEALLSDPEALPLRPIPVAFATSASSVPLFFWLLWLIPPVFTGAVWWRNRRLNYRRSHAAQYRRSEALEKASKTLNLARKQPASEAYRMVWQATLAYFSDKLNTTPGLLNYDDIEIALRQQSINPEIATLVLENLRQADEAQYAPFEAGSAVALSYRMIKILNRVDATWE